MKSTTPTIKRVFWTSGWDSSFRVLELLHRTDCVIQPYYLIYLGRKTTLIELRTVNRMMDAIERRPEWRGRVRNPIMHLADRYKYANEPYASALVKVRESFWLGSQYLCMAQFRDESGLEGLEVGLVKGTGMAYSKLKEWVEPKPGEPENFRLRADAPEELQVLFRGYDFPVMRLSKQEMGEHADAGGYREVLEMAWFCHDPIDDKPCGTCHPCQVTIRGGMGARVGEPGLARFAAMENNAVKPA